MAQDLSQDEIMEILGNVIQKIGKEGNSQQSEHQNENESSKNNTKSAENTQDETVLENEKDKITNQVRGYFNTLANKDQYEFNNSHMNESNQLVVSYDSVNDKGFSGKDFVYDFTNQKADEVNHTVTDKSGKFEKKYTTINTISADELQKFAYKDQNNEQQQDNVFQEHENDLNQSLDEELKADQSNQSYLSHEEVESLLNNHLEKVQTMMNDYNKHNLSNDNDSIRSALKESVNNFKTAVGNKVTNKTQAAKDSINSVKNSAKTKITNGLDKINQSLKNVSQRIDNKISDQQNKDNNVSYNNEVNDDQQNRRMQQEVENKLKNDPELLKSSIAIYSLHETEKYMNKTKDQLDKLSSIQAKDETEQQKLNKLQTNLQNEYKNAYEKHQDLKSNLNQDQTLKNVSEQVQEKNDQQEQQELEQEKEKENQKESEKNNEKTLQR